jgi:5-methylcytosine-specific restriction endonuclease McrA
LPPKHHDSPYADESSSSRPSRPKSPRRPPRAEPRATAANGKGRAHAAEHTNGNGHAAANGNPRKRRRRSGKGVYRQDDGLTSHPTTRNAYVGTREWLLAQHGPVCAYCGTRWAADKMTLDHVAPRRGQTAYDRRDNLVLACQPCNAAKRDLAPLAFLLGNRARAKNLVRFGEHLSPGLIDLAKSLLPEGFEFEEDSPYRD